MDYTYSFDCGDSFSAADHEDLQVEVTLFSARVTAHQTGTAGAVCSVL